MPPVAAFTFDDGYRDLVTTALPILEGNNVPFTLFVPTGAPTRSLYSWWLGLRTLVRTHDILTLEPMNKRFICQTFQDKVATLREIERWVTADFSRKSALKATFATASVSFPELNHDYFLGEEELRELARRPLASIGAHTSSHAALATLDVDTASEEMAENRTYLENLLQRPVEHIAFPYGTPRACGPREAGLAKKLGFLSALTSQTGQFLAGAEHDQYFLPRLGITTKEAFRMELSGFKRALSLLHLGRTK